MSVITDDNSSMNPDNPIDDNLPVSLQLQVDERCLKFESELQAAKHPKIEQYIENVEPPLYSKLLHELLLIEFEFLEDRGEQIELFEFLKRFSVDGALVQSTYAEHVARRASRILETEAHAGNKEPNQQISQIDSHGSSSGLSDSSHHGRFLPGAKVADRYRIVSLLGKGGMGEVYRADDLKLGQTVALKFLPPQLAKDAKRLEYFHEEVSLTRQISHPNVCRVYDIGEVDGQYFLSMEYIDGEDLKILLRRIGRLPKDKGLQIAQQLCAGLTAAHEKGVLHRDLKPANIMIDGHGQVRITDFGLARLVDEGQRGEITGTPAYMAPEQMRHGQTTKRSDVYSLGLLLYEIFTGEPVNKSGSLQELLQKQDDSSPSKPSGIVEDMDPIIERVILRCLEKEPHERPNSALAVAAALPGGDVLAAALAAGETPSPEMLIAAGDNRLINTRLALCLLMVALSPIIILVFRSQLGLDRSYPFEMPLEPAVLQQRCRDYMKQLGYEKPFKDSVSGFVSMKLKSKGTNVEAETLNDHPYAIRFWYRASQEMIRPIQRSIMIYSVSEKNPPRTTGDQAGMRLDPEGRLTDFWAFRQTSDWGKKALNRVDDNAWESLLSLVADDVLFQESTISDIKPQVPVDQRKAWSGSLADGRPFRVEAGGYQGRIVWAHATSLSNDQQWVAQFSEPDAPLHTIEIILLSVFYVILIIASTLAWRNVKLGRVNRTGAFRIAFLAFAAHQLYWFLSISRVPVVWEGFTSELFLTLGTSMVHGALVAIVYLAIEPYVRRWWPDSIVGWTRLLSKGFNDPIVGRDVLVGLAGISTLFVASSTFPDTGVLYTPEGIRMQLAATVLPIYFGCLFSIVLVFVVVISKVITGFRWPGLILAGLLIVGDIEMALFSLYPGWVAPLVMILIICGVLIFELVCWGALPVAVTYAALHAIPPLIGERLSDWTNQPFLIACVVITMLSLFSFHRALNGRPIFGPKTINPK